MKATESTLRQSPAPLGAARLPDPLEKPRPAPATQTLASGRRPTAGAVGFDPKALILLPSRHTKQQETHRDTRVQKLAKCMNLEADKDFTDSFINSVNAMGAGKTPEKVSEKLKEFQGRIDQLKKDWKESAPPSKRSQASNLSKAFALNYISGFGLSTLATKASAESKVVLGAGALIVGMSEVLTAKLRAKGPGYPAADLAAYQELNHLREEIYKNDYEADHGRSKRGAIRLQEANKALNIKVQGLCADLLLRENGLALGMAKDGSDVPLSFSSQLTVKEDGSVWLPADADMPDIEAASSGSKHLFTCDKNSKPGEFCVTWQPGGERTNLKKDPVPDEYVRDFKVAEGRLQSAAMKRSFYCDDLPFLSFALTYAVSGAMAPYMKENYDETTARVSDTALSSLMCFAGTAATVFGQNVFRSWWAGGEASKGDSGELNEMIADRANLEVKALKAIKSEIDVQIARIDDELQGEVPEARAKELSADKARLEHDIKELLPALKAAQVLRRDTKHTSCAVLTGATQSWKDMFGPHLSQTLCRMAGYTAVFAGFSQLFVPIATTPAIGAFTGAALVVPYLFRNTLLGPLVHSYAAAPVLARIRAAASRNDETPADRMWTSHQDLLVAAGLEPEDHESIGKVLPFVSRLAPSSAAPDADKAGFKTEIIEAIKASGVSPARLHEAAQQALKVTHVFDEENASSNGIPAEMNSLLQAIGSEAARLKPTPAAQVWRENFMWLKAPPLTDAQYDLVARLTDRIPFDPFEENASQRAFDGVIQSALSSGADRRKLSPALMRAAEHDGLAKLPPESRKAMKSLFTQLFHTLRNAWAADGSPAELWFAHETQLKQAPLTDENYRLILKVLDGADDPDADDGEGDESKQVERLAGSISRNADRKQLIDALTQASDPAVISRLGDDVKPQLESLLGYLNAFMAADVSDAVADPDNNNASTSSSSSSSSSSVEVELIGRQRSPSTVGLLSDLNE